MRRFGENRSRRNPALSSRGASSFDFIRFPRQSTSASISSHAFSSSYLYSLFMLALRSSFGRVMSTMTSGLPASSIPIFTTVSDMRDWRRRALLERKTVGFVPTMGALHDGHISLVKRSLEVNDLTVVSIFVNPAQFAPHEDLATYPRTLPSDLDRLTSLSVTVPLNNTSNEPTTRKASAVFLPSAREMYPSGIVQDITSQKGTFIEVKGYSQQMEGMSRPTFFRGVATVVTKLFNAVEPTHAYFGQKDIQQALLLRRLTSDLLLSHPEPHNLHIVPTHRSGSDNLALSSRNAYLSPPERAVAGTLYAALKAGESAWKAGGARNGAVAAAKEVVEKKRKEAERNGVVMKLDYVEMNDPETFDVVEWETKEGDGRPVILSGALWVGKTRLIDNLILGDSGGILT